MFNYIEHEEENILAYCSICWCFVMSKFIPFINIILSEDKSINVQSPTYLKKFAQ